MKKQWCFFLLLSLCLSTALLAQKKPAERFPEFIYLSDAEAAVQKSSGSLFQKYYHLKATDALRPIDSETDVLGLTQEKFQQYYKNVIVDGATSTIHSKNGKPTLLSGNYTTVESLNTVPTVSARTAFAAAVAHVGARRYMWDEPKSEHSDYEKPSGDLVVVVDFEGKYPAKLAYKFDIYAIDTLYRAYVYIDAHTGKYIKEELRIHHADVPATGNSLYNGPVSFTAESVAGPSFRLRQATFGGGIHTFNMNNGTNYAAATDFTSASTNFSADPVGVEAHWSSERTYDFFKQLGRNSYDDAGAVIKSYVHFSNNYVNAFWDGSRMTYGDGSGAITPLVTLDICGHEIAHAVTQFSAGLIYANESGALNESFSDIFGEAIEHFASGTNNWLIGSEINWVIRSMSNPNATSCPDTYLGTFWDPAEEVHTNSGVQNKWFYLLTQGENGTNDNGAVYCVKGIGIQNAARIAYRNLTVYLSASSDYAAARTGAIQAARDLFGVGSAEEIATTNAWYAVGVGAAYPMAISINCPANQTVSNAPGLCAAPVFYSTPVGSATCATTLQTSGLPSGSSFPVGLTVNTFKVTDALNNATATCSFTIRVNDVEKPSIVCPTDLVLNCDASIDPSMTGNPTVSDNCAVGPVTHTDVNVPGACAGNFTINRTWKVADLSTNANACTQVIKLQDVTAPVVTCPADITVDCDTTPAKTGMAMVLDNCDPNPKLGYSNVVTGGDCDWHCVIERSWVGIDNCGNDRKCVQVITRSTLPLIEAALNKDVNGDGTPDLLVMGHSNSTITLPPGTGNCILKYLPYAAGMAPSSLKFGKPVVGANCLPGTNPVDVNLRLKNPLLGEALKLAIIVRLQPNVGKTLLSSLNCTIHPVVLQALKPNPDINELLRVTHLTLGNINFGPAAHKQFLLDALVCVNAPLKVCSQNQLR